MVIIADLVMRFCDCGALKSALLANRKVPSCSTAVIFAPRRNFRPWRQARQQQTKFLPDEPEEGELGYEKGSRTKKSLGVNPLILSHELSRREDPNESHREIKQRTNLAASLQSDNHDRRVGGLRQRATSYHANAVLLATLLQNNLTNALAYGISFVDSRGYFTHIANYDAFDTILLAQVARFLARDALKANRSPESGRIIHTVAKLCDALAEEGQVEVYKPGNALNGLAIPEHLTHLPGQTPVNCPTAMLLLLDAIEKWIDSRPVVDAMTPGFEVLKRRMGTKWQRLVSRRQQWFLQKDLCLFNEAEYRIVEKKAAQYLGDEGDRRLQTAVQLKRKMDLGYDPDCELAQTLIDPVPETDYLGSPYSTLNLTAADYLKRYEEQIKMESDDVLAVENVGHTKRILDSAEALIEKWGWRETIRQEIDHRFDNIQHHHLKPLLSVMDRDYVAEMLVNRCRLFLSRDNPIFEHGKLVYAMGELGLWHIEKRFVDAILPNKKTAGAKLFSEYARYFQDPEISRTAPTHRQWWIRCAMELGVNMHAAQTHLLNAIDRETREMLGQLFIEILLDSCKFPYAHIGRFTAHSGTEGRMTNAFDVHYMVCELESEFGMITMAEDGTESISRAENQKVLTSHRNMKLQMSERKFDNLYFASNLQPMLVPPRPFLDGGEGGSVYTRQCDAIRKYHGKVIVDSSMEMRERLRKTSQARPVWDALNDISATPWRINRPVLDVQLEVFRMTLDNANRELCSRLAISMHRSTVFVPNFVAQFGDVSWADVPADQLRYFNRERYNAVKKINQVTAIWCCHKQSFSIANHYKDKIFWMPHNMDFRGRCYPLSPFFSHMGDDVKRGCLLFAHGKPLGPDGLRWLVLHCINLTGKMKRDATEERIAYGESILDSIIDSAQRPLDGSRWWINSEKPWQTLAACMEIEAAIASGDPETFCSRLPVHQDGSCNGLQHYAALGRDLEGAIEVNLVPSERPHDLYSAVAVRVEEKRIADEAAGNKLALELRKVMPEAITRKIVKQPVMTTVYGVTFYGAIQQIFRQLRAYGLHANQTVGLSGYLCTKTFASLLDAFTGSMEMKDWFRLCASKIVRIGRTVEWETPLGLPVIQPYMNEISHHGKLIVEPVVHKQVNGFPPNFIHSLDATHMFLTAISCARHGVSFAAIHDCYWTHAADVTSMNMFCRKQFVALHRRPIVDICGQRFKELYLTDKLKEAIQRPQYQAIEKVFGKKHAQGELKIEDVLESEYFFS